MRPRAPRAHCAPSRGAGRRRCWPGRDGSDDVPRPRPLRGAPNSKPPSPRISPSGTLGSQSESNAQSRPSLHPRRLASSLWRRPRLAQVASLKSPPAEPGKTCQGGFRGTNRGPPGRGKAVFPACARGRVRLCWLHAHFRDAEVQPMTERVGVEDHRPLRVNDEFKPPDGVAGPQRHDEDGHRRLDSLSRRASWKS